MAGSLVAVFGGLLAFLEGKLDLRSVRGAPLAKGDVIRYHSERTEDLEQRAEEVEQRAKELERDAEEQKRESRQQKRQIEQQKNENERLKKTIRLLAQITTSSSDIDLRDELDRELDLLAALPVDSDYAGTLPESTAGIAHDHDSHAAQPPDHDHYNAVGVEEDSLRARRWSEDAGWVGCPVGAINANGGGDAIHPAAAIEMTQIAVPMPHHSQPAGAVTCPFTASALVSHTNNATNVADTMVGITVHAGDGNVALDLPAPPPQQQPVKAARTNARASASSATKSKTVAKASVIAFSAHVDLDQARGRVTHF